MSDVQIHKSSQQTQQDDDTVVVVSENGCTNPDMKVMFVCLPWVVSSQSGERFGRGIVLPGRPETIFWSSLRLVSYAFVMCSYGDRNNHCVGCQISGFKLIKFMIFTGSY